MRAPTLWNPFREMAALNPFLDLSPLMKDFAVPTLLEPEPAMRMDVSGTDSGYVVKAELPGVAKDDVKVSVEGRTVTIEAETRRDTEAKEGDKAMRRERYYGALARSFTLPDALDVEHASAAFDNGVLTLTLPKADTAKACTLPVH